MIPIAVRLGVLLQARYVDGIDPFAYLKDVFARLPSMTNWQINEITPKAWASQQRTAVYQAAA